MLKEEPAARVRAAGAAERGVARNHTGLLKGAGMFGHRIKLFTLFGFPVSIDLSWFLIAILIAWSLASGVFPTYAKGLNPADYWVMGVVGAIGLFACVVLHEFGHSLVARRFGINMRGITLFVFGGVSEMTDEPPSAKSEFVVAVVGPAVSVALAGALYGLSRAPWPKPVEAVLLYLGIINLMLAGFNLLPAFPLDGGRVLRAALWYFKGNMRWATRIAAQVGSGFGIALMFLGALNLLAGGFISAIWWFILGMFLRNGARMSYRQLVWRQLLHDTTVGKLMNPEPKTVAPGVTIQSFVEDYVYRYHFKMFPAVEEDGKLLGCITTGEIKDLPREEWPNHTVGELLKPCSEENAIDQSAHAETVLATMMRTGRSRLMAVDGGRLVGVVTLKDITEYIARRVELEGDHVAWVNGHPH